MTSIGNFAFDRCSSLKSVTIPSSVTIIGQSAFDRCSSLKSVTIPDSVTIFRDAAFFNCKSLTTVTFHGDAPKVGNDVFLDATPTIYRKPEAKGWGETFGGRPVKLISENPNNPLSMVPCSRIVRSIKLPLIEFERLYFSSLSC